MCVNLTLKQNQCANAFVNLDCSLDVNMVYYESCSAQA